MREKKIVINTDYVHVVNIDAIASALTKNNAMLEKVTAEGNAEAIATWTRICAKTKWQWIDAMIEHQTGGRYSHQY
jgi:hypothetical protein